MIRSAGILMPISACSSNYGIGTLGKEAEAFVDFLVEAGQTYWQFLPTGPTGISNSPYQSFSAYAGNPYLIDLDYLIEDGLLEKAEVQKIKWAKKEDVIDYSTLYNNRFDVLKLATNRLIIKHSEEYLQFIQEEKSWLYDYAVFMAIKNDQGGKPWFEWPEDLRDHKHHHVEEEAIRLKDEVLFYERIQYLFYKQLKALKTYANERGIQLIGDLPFYVAYDSVDTWAHPEAFDMDEKFALRHVSGMPDGQVWGNPLFNWDYLKQNNYDWWMNRTIHQFKYVDVMRIDHFRGYDTYYAIDAENNQLGEWRKGPGLDIFKKLEEKIGKRDIILEDLGELTHEFLQLVKESGYPGMRILQYAFDPNDPGSIYMPFQYEKNTVVYTGTHDNNTLAGWLKDKNEAHRVNRAKAYLGLNKEEGYLEGMLRCAYASQSDIAIVQIQDLLGLDETKRTNYPGKDKGNWTFRLEKGQCSKAVAKKLKEKMLLYCRNNWQAKLV